MRVYHCGGCSNQAEGTETSYPAGWTCSPRIGDVFFCDECRRFKEQEQRAQEDGDE